MSPSWTVPAAERGERLDRALARHLALPRNQILAWIHGGHVRVQGVAVKPSYLLAAGERLEWMPPPPPPQRLEPEEGELEILYQDDSLLVLDKPAGLTVHPGAGRRGGTLANRLLARFPEVAGVGGPGRPGIVHRLDRGTSGLLVVARSGEAYRGLAASFASRKVGKTYLAIVWGVPRPASGSIEAPISRHPDKRQQMAVRVGGRPAKTGYRVLAQVPPVGLLALDLATGRTHQIRVHLKHLGHPLVGDPVYGEARWKEARRPLQSLLKGFPRPALHAWRLALQHPISGENLRFEAPPPADFCNLWEGIAGSDLRMVLERAD